MSRHGAAALEGSGTMTMINPNLLAAAGSPIMEAAGWRDATPLPDGMPLIDLSQAAPATPPHESIRQRLADAALNEPRAHHYGNVLGNDDLRAEIATQWSDRYGGMIKAGQVAVTAGCNQAFCTALMTACAPGDAVMLPAPWYFNHKMWLDMAGLRCVPLPCSAGMLPDLDTARRRVGDVKAMVLVTPNNPTGAEYPDDLMRAFFDLAREAGVVLIVDETYRDFHSADGAPHTLFQQTGWEETLVHLYSFSKTYRIMGHRCGAMITGAERVEQAEKFLDTVTICPTQMGQIAALHGLRTLGNWVTAERAEFLGRRRLLEALFAEKLSNWRLHGAGAYFAFVSPPGGADATVTAQRLLAEQAILALPGSMFLPSDMPTDTLRIAFANADGDGIREVVRRLGAFA